MEPKGVLTMTVSWHDENINPFIKMKLKSKRWILHIVLVAIIEQDFDQSIER